MSKSPAVETTSPEKMKGKVVDGFAEQFGEPPAFVVRAPGRVNLIGEHTDYNDGFVLPMAIDRSVWVAFRHRDDRRVVVHSLDFGGETTFKLEDIAHQNQGWAEYVKGVAWGLKEGSHALEGWEGVLAGDVPLGAGLSSSAALELAIAKAFNAVSKWDWDGPKIAQLARKAENDFVGVSSGIMDQMISALGIAGHAMLLDCRSLEARHVPLPTGTTIIVLDTATRRGLIDSAYNERVAQCQAAADFFGVPALRDVSPETFRKKANQLDPVIRKRARHVIFENERTLKAVEAMRGGRSEELGELMNASHESLREDYEVSSQELNTMVTIAQEQNGCLGARMTGAGFGGCAVALVEFEAAEAFSVSVRERYQADTGLTPNITICEAANGAEVVQ